MGRKRKEETVITNNLAVGVLFCLFIGVLLFGSLMLKVIDLVRKSSYDGTHKYTIAVFDDTASIQDPIHVISFSPDANSISVLVLSEIQKQGEITRVITGDTVGRYLGIPIDATVVGKNTQLLVYNVDDKKVDRLFENIIFSFTKIKTHMTILDTARIYFFAKTISPSSVKVQKLEENLDEVSLDKISASLFVDDDITEEKQSIQIVNGADILGLGNRLARIISNMGGNVISVITAPKDVEKSEIQYTTEEIPYTAQKLSRILSIPLVKVQDSGISDIIIKIGKDKAGSSFF